MRPRCPLEALRAEPGQCRRVAADLCGRRGRAARAPCVRSQSRRRADDVAPEPVPRAPNSGNAPPTSAPISKPEVHEAAPSGRQLLVEAQAAALEKRCSTETGCLPASASPRSNSAPRADRCRPVAHQHAVIAQQPEHLTGRHRQELLHHAVVQRHPLGMRARQADELAARPVNAGPAASAPSSWVSSPRITSGAPSGLVQRMPGNDVHASRGLHQPSRRCSPSPPGTVDRAPRPSRRPSPAMPQSIAGSSPCLPRHRPSARRKLPRIGRGIGGARTFVAVERPALPSHSAKRDCWCPSRRR